MTSKSSELESINLFVHSIRELGCNSIEQINANAWQLIRYTVGNFPNDPGPLSGTESIQVVRNILAAADIVSLEWISKVVDINGGKDK